MASAFEKVINTTELLEHILVLLPVDLLLIARRVSRLWRELILRSERYQKLESKPYFGVTLDVSNECSIADGEPGQMTANIVLHCIRPVAMRKVPWSIEDLSHYAWNVEVDASPDDPDLKHPVQLERVGEYTASGSYRSKDGWTAVYPGELYSLTRQFRPKPCSNAVTGVPSRPQAGKTYAVRLFPDSAFTLPILLQESTLRHGDERYKDPDWINNIYPVLENEARFTLVP